MKEVVRYNKEIATISSREIAQMMEMTHADVLKKLDGTSKSNGKTKQIGIIPVLAKGNFPVSDYFIEAEYKDNSGKTNPMYLCTKLGCDFLANKFNGEKGILFTARYVKRFNEMEMALKPALPASYKEALIALVAEIEKTEKLELEVQHKASIIEGLTENISLAEKRQRVNQIVRHMQDGECYQDRYNLLYKEFEAKYHLDLKKRLANAKAKGVVKQKTNRMGYICQYLNMTDELYDLTAKLFEGDFLSLLEEWKQVVIA